jgi:hypothetical protein
LPGGRTSPAAFHMERSPIKGHSQGAAAADTNSFCPGHICETGYVQLLQS